MKKIITAGLALISKPKKKGLSIQEQNKLLLRQSLRKCYNIGELIRLQTVFKLSAKEFSLKELLDFKLDINHRITLIKLSDVLHGGSEYTAGEIFSRFKIAESLIEVDALLLHIEAHQTFYTRQRCDLSVFYNMADKRANQLIEEMYAEAA